MNVDGVYLQNKIIFIANPNNPTGSYLNKDEINKLVSNIPSNVLIVLDHAYQEFVTIDDFYDGIRIVNNHKNVVLTRTFSKIYGLASLRIGWSYSSQNIADILNKARGPFNVSGPAQVSALASLDDDDFYEASKNHNTKWLKILNEELKLINKIKIYSSIANFILIDFLSNENCENVNKKLLENSIIFREMKGYGLPSCLRATIGTAEENEIIIENLKKICHGL